MSVEIQGVDERQLRFSILKTAIGVTMMVLVIAVVALLFADKGQGLMVTALMAALSFAFLTNGLLAVLRIIDWFETRRIVRGGVIAGRGSDK